MKSSLLLLLALIVTPYALAEEFNAGFVQGLWYSDEAVFADTPVRVYVAIRNNTGADLTGRVEFYDNDKLIVRNNVSALDGRIIESWADWTPSHGTHTVSASLSRIELHQVGSSTQAVEVSSALAEDTIFVDYDTDKDGVGNDVDADDDGDGISDKVEVKNQTDPLVYDKPTPVKETNSTSPEESDDESDNDEETTDEAGDSTPQIQAGLEQYLTPSPAHTALSSLSNFVTTSKHNLDTYRENRNQNLQDEQTAPTIDVDDSGFGEVTRSTDTPSESASTDSEVVENTRWITSILSVFKTLFNVVYTALLSGLSLYLGHPMILQLTLLIMILFTIYKLARKFGDRPRR